ncbi:MAG: STAS domain-containing protein [Pseudomonadota bacterium]
MELSAVTAGDVRVISIASERIDAAAAIRFKDSMREATAGWSGRVILNMQAVDFIDSSGLGAIVSAMKALEGGQGLELAGLAPKVVKVFRLTRMDTVFTIHASLDAAHAPGHAHGTSAA